jgi:signal recognition particle GTPase
MENLNNQIQIKELIQDLSYIGGYVQQLEQKILSLEWDIMHLTEENKELKESSQKKIVGTCPHKTNEEIKEFFMQELESNFYYSSIASEIRDEINLDINNYGGNCQIEAELDESNVKENLNNQIQIKELIQDLSHIGGYVQQLEQKVLSLEWDITHLTEENRELKESSQKKSIKIYNIKTEEEIKSLFMEELEENFYYGSISSEIRDEITLDINNYGGNCQIEAELDEENVKEIIERQFRNFIDEMNERYQIIIEEKKSELDSDIIELERGE